MFAPSKIWKMCRHSVLPLGIKYKVEYAALSGALDSTGGPVMYIGSTFMVARDETKNVGLFATAYHLCKKVEEEKQAGGGEGVALGIVEEQIINALPVPHTSARARACTAPYAGKAEDTKDFAIYAWGPHEILGNSDLRPIQFSTDINVGDPVVALGYEYVGETGRKLGDKKEYRMRLKLTTAHVAAIGPSDKGIEIEFDNFAA